MNDIYPIKNQISISIMDTNIPFVLLVVFAVVLVFFVVKLYRRRTLARLKHTLLEQLDTSKACKVGEALKRLQTLERLIGEGKFHELYIRSTEVVKSTLAEVFEVKVREMTTKEIANISFQEDLKEIVLDFLKKNDRVKFADIESEQKEAQRLFTLAKETLRNLEQVAKTIDEKNTEKAHNLLKSK